MSNELTLSDVTWQTQFQAYSDDFCNIWRYRLDWTSQCDVVQEAQSQIIIIIIIIIIINELTYQ